MTQQEINRLSATPSIKRLFVGAALAASASLVTTACVGDDYAYGDTDRGESAGDTFVDDDFPIGRSLELTCGEELDLEDLDVLEACRELEGESDDGCGCDDLDELGELDEMHGGDVEDDAEDDIDGDRTWSRS